MKKNLWKKIFKNLYKMNLLEDLRMSLSSFNSVMIHTIHKILVLIKNHMNYLQDFFLRSIADFYFKKRMQKTI